MRILSINGTYRKNGTTTRLTEMAMEGAASMGADTEMILLTEKDIRYCTNCLTCYKDLDSKIAPCIIEDDVHDILIKIGDAGGVLFASPVHSGFVSALMTTFIHRASCGPCYARQGRSWGSRDARSRGSRIRPALLQLS